MGWDGMGRDRSSLPGSKRSVYLIGDGGSRASPYVVYEDSTRYFHFAPTNLSSLSIACMSSPAPLRNPPPQSIWRAADRSDESWLGSARLGVPRYVQGEVAVGSVGLPVRDGSGEAKGGLVRRARRRGGAGTWDLVGGRVVGGGEEDLCV